MTFWSKMAQLFYWRTSLPKRQIRAESEACRLVGLIEEKEFQKLKKDIFRIIIFTFYQKNMGQGGSGGASHIDLSVYDIARNEKDLIRLNKLSDEGWREVLKEMVSGTLEVLDLFENKKYIGKSQLKVALINLPVLKRASFKII